MFGDVSVDTVNLKNKIADMSKQTGISAEELNETTVSGNVRRYSCYGRYGDGTGSGADSGKTICWWFYIIVNSNEWVDDCYQAYGLSADDASRIADEFILVQNKGVTTVDELASNMGRAISTGSAYGVNLEI